jgi:drug/metabolite transporter (DMT)-like permease
MSPGPYAGIGLALLAATAYNVGVILEKRALGRMAALDVRRVVHVVTGLLTDPAWLAGFGLMLTGLACQVIVLTFEPVSVVQPVLASGVALLLVLSRLVLGERLGRAEFWCVAAMAVALVLLALSAGEGSAAAGHHASGVLMAAVMIPSVVIGLLVACRPLRAPAGQQRARAISYGIGTGLLYGVSALAIKALSGILVRHQAPASLVIGILSSPYLYVLAGCSAAAMLLFQAGLQSCRASIMVPVSSVSGSVYFVIAGTWLFHERLPAAPDKLALRLAAIAVAGLVLVTLARQDPARAEPAPAGRHARTQLTDSGLADSGLADSRRQSWP